MNIYDWERSWTALPIFLLSILPMMTVGHGSGVKVTFLRTVIFRKWIAKRDGWIYMLGTQAGRGDAAYLRVSLRKIFWI